ncbi:hypothetical protein [Ornithinibacillus scapharcae]|uniref:hypothetical protein n=1 Tax=Ornithinibacillus scapharcae TaxID=1147159 RepID=UPI000225AFE7|nr:hypothetical protein [Ornithinibacillus scapharcae]
MNDTTLIQERLHLQGLPVYPSDIAYIQSTLNTLLHAQNSLLAFPNINTEVPITVVEKRLLQ